MILSVGDKVMWRGGFGQDAPKVAIVKAMELTALTRDKEGMPTPQVSWDYVEANRVVFTLDNGHWAYSDQISPYVGE